MQKSKMPLQINLNTKVENNALIIEVQNSGKWVEHNSQNSNGTGTGLKNIRERLENAFPENYNFDIKKSENQVSVIIKIISNFLEQWVRTNMWDIFIQQELNDLEKGIW